MTVAELRNLFDEARPLVKQWLDLSEQFSAFRLTATEKGFDWSQIKALLKAQTQDERDGGNDHVRRIVERAEYASSYAAQLGLMNENNYSDEPIEQTEDIREIIAAAPVKAAAENTERGEPREAVGGTAREAPIRQARSPADGTIPQGAVGNSGSISRQMDEDVPVYLRRVG